MHQSGAFSPHPECETGRIVSSGRPLPDPIYKGVQDLECFAPIDQGEYECQHDQDSTDNFYRPHTNRLTSPGALHADGIDTGLSITFCLLQG